MRCLLVLAVGSGWLRAKGAPASFSLDWEADAGKQNWLAIRKFDDQGQAATHSFDVAAQGRKQEIASAFDARNPFLADAEFIADACLRLGERCSAVLGDPFAGSGRV